MDRHTVRLQDCIFLPQSVYSQMQIWMLDVSLILRSSAIATLGRFEESLTLIDEGLALEHDNSVLLTLKGGVLASLERYEEVEKGLEKVEELLEDPGAD